MKKPRPATKGETGHTHRGLTPEKRHKGRSTQAPKGNHKPQGRHDEVTLFHRAPPFRTSAKVIRPPDVPNVSRCNFAKQFRTSGAGNPCASFHASFALIAPHPVNGAWNARCHALNCFRVRLTGHPLGPQSKRPGVRCHAQETPRCTNGRPASTGDRSRRTPRLVALRGK